MKYLGCCLFHGSWESAASWKASLQLTIISHFKQVVRSSGLAKWSRIFILRKIRSVPACSSSWPALQWVELILMKLKVESPTPWPSSSCSRSVVRSFSSGEPSLVSVSERWSP